MEKLVILHGLNESVWQLTYTSIISIAQNTKSEFISKLIYFEDISKDILKEFKKLEEKYPNCKIDYLKLENNDFVYFKNQGLYVYPMSLYHLILPDILTEYNKVLCLSPTSIVNGNIKELFDIDISNYDLACTKSIVKLKTEEKKRGLRFEDSINCNMLLLNLEKMRKEKFFNKVKDIFSRNIKPDIRQPEILYSICFKDSALILPYKYANLLLKGKVQH